MRLKHGWPVVLGGLFGAMLWLTMPTAPPTVAPDTQKKHSSVIPADTSFVPVPVDTNEPVPSKALDLLAQAKAMQLNLVETIGDIRQRCLPEWEREECNDMTRQFLQDKAGGNDPTALLAVYDQLIRYEDHIVLHQPLQQQDLSATWAILRELRRQYFDVETRDWLFGAEDARMTYEFARRAFEENEAPLLTPADRLQKLEQIREQSLGPYYSLFKQRENPLNYDESQQ